MNLRYKLIILLAGEESSVETRTKLSFGDNVVSLKMICNDFLVVKVNGWSYVFNIIQSI